jgi:hypothetical protein
MAHHRASRWPVALPRSSKILPARVSQLSAYRPQESVVSSRRIALAQRAGRVRGALRVALVTLLTPSKDSRDRRGQVPPHRRTRRRLRLHEVEPEDGIGPQQLELGLYPLLDGDRCCWLAADFDGPTAMPDALACLKAARAAGAPAALEVSRSGLGARPRPRGGTTHSLVASPPPGPGHAIRRAPRRRCVPTTQAPVGCRPTREPDDVPQASPVLWVPGQSLAWRIGTYTVGERLAGLPAPPGCGRGTTVAGRLIVRVRPPVAPR